MAKRMGFDAPMVHWEGVPFNKSFAPGPKDFDFAMQQISITPKRAKAVDFSDGYYNVNQGLMPTTARRRARDHGRGAEGR